jgi:putative DNA methylase
VIPKECKRLAEVDFPIAVVSKHSAREKSIRHGHPSTLHLWWARRPLAACRAILLGLLLPDPCDPECPKDFKINARELLPKVQGNPGPKDEDLRQALLKFIGDFSKWDLSADRTYLEVSRGLVWAAHPKETPLVVDPFAGGGSIPLEALRLGCETFASDLNPVACLILKVMLEDIPRHGPELADELRRFGNKIKEAAEKELKEFYPEDPGGSKPIAYLWARTVRCESPNCGAEIPIYRSLWLSKRGESRARYFQEADGGKCTALLIENAPRGGTIEYRIARGHGSEDPRPGFSKLSGTKAPGNNANVICPCCGTTLSGSSRNPRTSIQLADQRGGADVIFDERGERIGGARLLAVVTTNPGIQGRKYRLATKDDYLAVWRAQSELKKLAKDRLSNGLSAIPDESLPPIGTLGFRVQRYGMLEWRDLFTSRQKLALVTLIREVSKKTDPIQNLLGAVVSRCVDYWSSGVLWAQAGEFVAHTFGRQALPIIWDFAEAVPWTDSSGNFDGAVDWVARVVEAWPGGPAIGETQIGDATQSSLPDQATSLWFTDPPYYDAVPYADLSDFFFVWLKRALAGHDLLRDPFDPKNLLTPKAQEIVQDEVKQVDSRFKDRIFFEERIAKAFAEGRRVLKDDGVGCVVFAHKTTEGWEALLSGMIQGGWTITGSWPIATERPGRLRSQESAALATSVHLVCRPRPEGAPVGDWGDVLRELPKRVGDWMERLQTEGVRGADLVFACIGPALEIFSHYSKVVDAEEREIPLGGDPENLEPHRRGFLAYVWEVVGRTALEQVLGTAEAKARNSTAGALEEDARLTALFLWTLQSTNGESPSPQPSPTKGRGREMVDSPEDGRGGESEEEEEDVEEDEEEETPKKKKQGYSLIFDVVRRFAQPLGIHLPEWEGRVIETEKGVVRLLSVKERGKQLFGDESISVAGFRIEEQARRDPQMKFDFAVRLEGAIAPDLPAEALAQAGIKSGRPRKKKELTAESSPKAGVTTTLDRIHAAMLLQSSGQTNALRALLKAEQDRGPDFLRLANALSALYPKGSEEKRLLDAMLLAMPRT